MNYIKELSNNDRETLDYILSLPQFNMAFSELQLYASLSEADVDDDTYNAIKKAATCHHYFEAHAYTEGSFDRDTYNYVICVNCRMKICVKRNFSSKDIKVSIIFTDKIYADLF